jgi:hypothetical protein
MKTQYTFLFFFTLCFAFSGKLKAQTPFDAIMMRQLETCIGLVYEHSWFDEYWEGELLRVNGTIATVKRNAVTPMVAFGVFDNLNLLVGASYVQTESTAPNGGYFAGAKGFQDFMVALKGELLNKQIGPGNLAILATAGFSTPMTNYLSDYRPYSIGFGANEYSLRGILHYKFNMGVYVRGSLAYLERGQTEAERDYYYNNGSYYTPWMDVPSAWNYNAVAGYWMFGNTLKLEANYMGIISTSGDDIRPYNAAQPTNKVDFGILGISAQYYPKIAKGLGGLAYFSHTTNGRNTGKSSQFGVGLTYQFRI